MESPNDRVEALATAVADAAVARIGADDPALLRAVVSEVLATLAGDSLAEDSSRVAGSSRAPVGRSPTTAESSAAATDNGDGTVTTGLGSVIAKPARDMMRACLSCVEQQRLRNRNRAVVTATGINRRGVTARVAGAIAAAGGDIQDVSQTIVSDYFTLILVVNLDQISVSFAQLKQDIAQCAEEMGFHVSVMHEDVMQALQRL